MVLVAATAAGRRVLERGRSARVRAVADLLEGASVHDLAAVRLAAEIIARHLRER
jgi:hypothetical protein